MRRFFLLSLLAMMQIAVFSQKVFFKSAQTFSKAHMQEFYASVAVEKDYVLFIGADYKLYAYKKDGTLKWSSGLGYKTNTPPFPVEGRVWVTTYEDKSQVVKHFDIESGEAATVWRLSNIFTKPVIKNGIMYATGISKAGCVFAYDLRADSLLWQKFLAHGCSTTPYYYDDRIVANAEGDSWIDIGYDGKLVDRDCEDSTAVFPSELKCARESKAFTHDRREIKDPGAYPSTDDYSSKGPSVRFTKNLTFLLLSRHLYIFGNKLKSKARLDLAELSEKLASDDGSLSEILDVTEERIRLMCGNQLLVYNYKNKKLESSYDLTEWEPHQVVYDGDKVWLISKKDGLLYGLLID